MNFTAQKHHSIAQNREEIVTAYEKVVEEKTVQHFNMSSDILKGVNFAIMIKLVLLEIWEFYLFTKYAKVGV